MPPVMAKAGSVDKMTSVISHPVIKANTNPEIKVAMGMSRVPTF